MHTIGGETKLVDTDPYAQQADVNWAPDSNWLTYATAADNKAGTSIVWIYNIAEGTKHQVTSGFFNSDAPVFDREGDFLYFASNRAFEEPEYEDVGTTFIYTDTELILAVPLRADVELPMLPKSDEEEWDDEDGKDEDEDQDEDKDKDKHKDKDEDEGEDEDKDDDEDKDEDENDEDSEEDSDPITGTWAVELKSDEMMVCNVTRYVNIIIFWWPPS